MKTYLECIPCFLRQALAAAVLSGTGKKQQKLILDKVCSEIPKFNLKISPPEIAMIVYTIVRKVSGKKDPFKQIKRKSNRLALKLYKNLKIKVRNSNDRLLAAVELAIAGNIIDYGVKSAFNIEKEIKNILSVKGGIIKNNAKGVFDYGGFKRDLKKAEKIFYIGDNAGEIVFDRVLIEEMGGRKVVFAVRGKPVINDAVLEDALYCGIDKMAKIVSSGVQAPGTILKRCSKEFVELFKASDLVISKGQGNFETLNDEKKKIYFLFRTKCPVVARNVGSDVGSVILKKSGY